ncbi:hypothetical protein Tco_1314312 [Tanacetum coccineum]
MRGCRSSVVWDALSLEALRERLGGEIDSTGMSVSSPFLIDPVDSFLRRISLTDFSISIRSSDVVTTEFSILVCSLYRNVSSRQHDKVNPVSYCLTD